MSGMIDLNQEHYQRRILIRKIELMKGEID
jgi:hypothetical protein